MQNTRSKDRIPREKFGHFRAVAQLGRAPGSGPGGRGFKSHQPDVNHKLEDCFIVTCYAARKPDDATWVLARICLTAFAATTPASRRNETRVTWALIQSEGFTTRTEAA